MARLGALLEHNRNEVTGNFYVEAAGRLRVWVRKGGLETQQHVEVRGHTVGSYTSTLGQAQRHSTSSVGPRRSWWTSWKQHQICTKCKVQKPREEIALTTEE